MVPGRGSRGCAEGQEQSWGVGTEGRARELLVPSQKKQENSYHVLKGLEKAREHLSSGIPVRLNRATQGVVHRPVTSVSPGSMLNVVILRFHPRPTKPESRGVETGYLLNRLSWQFFCVRLHYSETCVCSHAYTCPHTHTPLGPCSPLSTIDEFRRNPSEAIH